MKKAIEARKPSKAKAPTQKGKGHINPILDLLENMDEDLIGMLRQTVQKEVDFGSAMFGPEDPVDLFAEYLERCALGDVDEDEKTEFLTGLVVELSDLKVDSNRGREKIQAIYDLLDNAIEGHSLSAIDIMMTGKILTDAGWAVPDNLRQAMARALQAAPPDTQGAVANDIVSPLLELAEQAGQNPFDVYEYLSSLLACFPAEARIMLLSELVAGKKAVIDQAVAGFLLHPDAVLAQSVAEALATSATQTPVESSLIERLVRMRTWLSSGMIRGIGPVYAKKMVKAFGEKVFDIIGVEPDRLREVDGIGPVRALRITAAWAEQKVVREIMVFLHSHGVGTARAVRIYKTYGTDALKVMSENPLPAGARHLRHRVAR